MIAAENKAIEVAKLLIANGADVDFRDMENDGATALILAIQKDDKDMVKLLIEAGANLELEEPEVGPWLHSPCAPVFFHPSQSIIHTTVLSYTAAGSHGPRTLWDRKASP